MTPLVRKFALIAHIVSSIGWMGAAAVYLALAVAALTSKNVQTVRATYLAMELAAWYVIVPSSLASLLTGLIVSLGTVWGLFRHYWVIFKLFLNLFAITILLMYIQSIGSFARMAGKETLSSADLSLLRRPTHVVHTSGALLVLLIATTLSVYKPQGVTPYGIRKRREERAAQAT
ncbi:MAG TPA: DUF2269 domain-containing protein [Thermoanaerobaculia bacterium]|nr:DUF2269 domain-containing protein [Thermoanaerobaculia bacterium]